MRPPTSVLLLQLVLGAQVLAAVGLVEDDDGVWVGSAALGRRLGRHAKPQRHVCGGQGQGSIRSRCRMDVGGDGWGLHGAPPSPPDTPVSRPPAHHPPPSPAHLPT